MANPETSGRSTTAAVEVSEDRVSARRGEARAAEHESHRRSFWREFPVLVVAAFALALLIKTFLLQAFYIPSGSMLPTLEVGERILVEKVSYRFGEPDRGDVVVFERSLNPALSPPGEGDSVLGDVVNAFRSLFGFPTGGDQDFVKRVMAVGGDTIEGREGVVYVNDEPVEEPYLPDGVATSDFAPQQVPAGQIFVMGDNRGNSDDSRSFGAVPADEVVGRAFLSIWPADDFGTV
ncbi:MAG: signal peptidase I [Actinomycetota bacterium]